MRKAYTVMKRVLDAGEFRASALLCITNATATGAMRALHEHGYQVGKDVSVCSFEGEGNARLQIPSRTVLESPDPAPYLDACLDWMGKRKEPWPGPLLIQPTRVTLFAGESTGPSLAPTAA
jgi:DNA-binding LacI/PurR family transcriptional regulator